MSHAAAAGSCESPLAEGRGGAVKQRAEAGLGLRAEDGIGTGEYVAIKQITGTSSEGDAGKHRVRRAEGREKLGTWDIAVCFFFSSRRRHTRLVSDWSSDVCSSD